MYLAARVATITVLMLAAQAPARTPDAAQQAYQQGQALLSKGDFDGALDAFKSAAAGQRSDEAIAQQYALLRQIVQLRNDLPAEKDPERWLAGAAALRTYYHERGFFSESLPLDEERFRRVPTAESAVLLARTQLRLGMTAPAAAVLAGLPAEARTACSKTVQALALVRSDRGSEAKALIGDVDALDAAAGADCFLDRARALARLGDRGEALASLKRTFELTAPSRIESLRAGVAGDDDFVALAATAEFAEVLKTPSTVKESPCSGGDGCAKCPKRAKCGSTAAAEKPSKP